MSEMMYGADADELEQIAKELDSYESELGQLLLQGVGAVSLVGLSATLGSIWRGPRASEFAGVWQSRHLLRLRDAQQILSAAANDLRGNATEQRATSSVGGGGFGLGQPGWRWPFGDVTIMPIPGGGWGNIDWIGEPWGSRAHRWFDNGLEWADRGLGWIEVANDGFFNGTDDVLSVFGHPKRWLEYGSIFPDELAPAGKFADGASTVGSYVGVLSFAKEGYDLVQAVDEHGYVSWQSGWALTETVWTGAGVVFPPAAWTKAAFDTGSFIGDQIYHHTPVGEYLLETHPSSQHIARAESISAEADALVSAGRFDEVAEMNRRASAAAAAARRESEGLRGVLNATETVLTAPFKAGADGVKKVGSFFGF